MRLSFVSLAPLALAAACGGGGGGSAGSPDAEPAIDAAPPTDAAIAPVFRNPVDLPDAELAAQALALLGAAVPNARESCGGCHGMDRSRVRYWRGLSDQAMTECLTDLTLSTAEAAKATLDCLRDEPAANGFAPEHLGIYAINAHLPWFEYVFTVAYGPTAATERERFLGQVSMPRGEQPLFTQAEFDIVAEWFARGVPQLDETLRTDPAPTQCLGSVSADVTSHVTSMRTQGWAAANDEAGLLMHGCAGAASPRDCLKTYPLATSRPFGTAWTTVAGASLRLLRENDYQSSYWTRSSPDGRFVAHGNGGDDGATLIDLAGNGGAGKLIALTASYDPGFFPDNSGMVFQTDRQPSGRSCLQRVLTASPNAITFSEPGCGSLSNVGLYQHVGGTVGGSDYWSIDGQFENDDLGTETGNEQRDPRAGFTGESTLALTAMVNTGSKFESRERIRRVPVPFQGDVVLSPSAKLVVTRLSGDEGAQLGYVLHRIDVAGTAGARTARLTEVARYCHKGGKPGFSLDERWMVVHHYTTDADAVELGFTGPSDPAFAAYRTKGSANIYLIDLVTGTRTRITRVGAGQFALFPHFRSDGWIYFMVRDPAATAYREYVVASDAALVLGAR